MLQQILGNIIVHLQHGGVHDAYVHPCLDGVVQKGRIDGLPNWVVPSKRKGNIADPATHTAMGKVILHPTGRLNEVKGIAPMFLHSCGHWKNIQVEDDVLWGKFHFVDQNIIGPFGNFLTAFQGIGLAHFIKGHHDHGSTISLDELCMVHKLFFTFFQADGIHHAFALYHLQSRLDDLPFGAIDHDGHTGNIGFGNDQVQEPDHSFFSIDQSIIHVHVDDLGASFHLISCNVKRLIELFFFDQPQKPFGTGHIGTLPHIDEIALGSDHQGFQTR